MPRHRRCCSRVDTDRARSQAPIALSIAYSFEFLFFLFPLFLFLVGHNSSVYLSAHQNDVRTAHFSTATTTSTLTSATLALRRYHLHVVLIGFNSSNSTFDLFSSLTVCGAPAVTTGGEVRVYLVGYIFYIIEYHIYQDIFGRIDIMYYKLPYVSGGVLPLRLLYSIYTD
jgi:hypothetical protein